MDGPALRYAVVTPVRNEAGNLRRLFASLSGQSVRPECWVIVDTGSTDGTVDLARTLAHEQPWIDFVADADLGATKRGGPIVRAFELGVSRLQPIPDVVVKVDADVSMGSAHFEVLLAAFAANPKLGIASGSAQELEDGVWRTRHNTGSSVWGAARAYRAACLADVRPLEEQMGWDGIDELKARVRGWTTETLVELPFRHHRAEGARDGSPWKAWTARGRASHYMGYRAWYLLARTLHHARSDRAALGMVWGYAAALATRQPVCADADVRGRLRQEQSLRNLRARRREALGGVGTMTAPQTDRAEVLLVCTAGGHLLQLWSLREAWQDRTHAWVVGEPRGQRRAVAAPRRPRLLRTLACEPEPEEPRSQPAARPAPPRRASPEGDPDHRGSRRRSLRLGRAAPRRPDRVHREPRPGGAPLAQLPAHRTGRRSRLRPVAGAARRAAPRALRRNRLPDAMILVAVGASQFPFDRLLRAVDELPRAEPLVVQHGPSAIRPVGARCLQFVPLHDLAELVREARVVVTHAGRRLDPALR